ncbi:MAG TPA: redoxin domain-containing protein [Planctomycetota bacterium]|nr:redoxin domain-containing protein [Planctomycetota bacterium]
MRTHLIPRLRSTGFLFLLLSLGLASALARPLDEEETSPAQRKTVAADGEKLPAALKLDLALEQRKLRKYDETLKLLAEAQSLDPPPALAAEILFRVGETHFRRGLNAGEGKLPGTTAEACFDTAIKTFGALVERYPKEAITPEAVYFSGSAYLVLGDFEKALERYQRAFDGYPTHQNRGRSLLRVGVCQAGIDQVDKAKVTFTRYLREFPGTLDETNKVRKYLYEMEMVGKPAPPIQSKEWIFGQVNETGLQMFEGEVVVLVFLASGCPNCSKELPHLRSLIDQWSPQGVVFLGLTDPQDPRSTEPIGVYVKKHEVPILDVALDTGSRTSRSYRVTGLPAAAIIDRRGIVRWRGHISFFSGAITEKALQGR